VELAPQKKKESTQEDKETYNDSGGAKGTKKIISLKGLQGSQKTSHTITVSGKKGKKLNNLTRKPTKS